MHLKLAKPGPPQPSSQDRVRLNGVNPGTAQQHRAGVDPMVGSYIDCGLAWLDQHAKLMMFRIAVPSRTARIKDDANPVDKIG